MDAHGKVLHVCTLDKFIPPFIDMIEDHFEDFASRHIFFIAGDARRYPFRGRDNIVFAERGKKTLFLHLPKLAKAMGQCDKIILHGLFNRHLVLLLFLMPWVLKKCYWIIWGIDLYLYHLGNHASFRWKVNEFFRRPIIKNIGNLVTGTPGDVNLARKWYKAKGQHIPCFNYPSNVFKEYYPERIYDHTETYILVGNSADPSNNHEEVLDKLKLYRHENIKIFCPLSYGDQKYASEVVAIGKSIFGDKFHPMTTFINRNNYLRFLQTIDIAIFNHKRQQAFGNTLMLLGYGKKVFIRKESTLNGVFESLGITVFDSSIIDIEKIKPQVASKNKLTVINNFSEKSLVDSLQKWIQ